MPGNFATNAFVDRTWLDPLLVASIHCADGFDTISGLGYLCAFGERLQHEFLQRLGMGLDEPGSASKNHIFAAAGLVVTQARHSRRLQRAAARVALNVESL